MVICKVSTQQYNRVLTWRQIYLQAKYQGIIYVHPLMKSHIGSTTEKKKENKLDCGHFRKNQQNLVLPGLLSMETHHRLAIMAPLFAGNMPKSAPCLKTIKLYHSKESEFFGHTSGKRPVMASHLRFTSALYPMISLKAKRQCLINIFSGGMSSARE